MSLEMFAALPLAQSAAGFLSLLAVLYCLLALLALAAALSSPAAAAGASPEEPSEAARSNGVNDVNNNAKTHDALASSTTDHGEAEVADYFDLDDSFDLSSEVDSEWLRSSGLDVDWELESVASSSASRASLNDTDLLLGGEAYDSSDELDVEEDEGEDENLECGAWGFDIDSVCSSLNDSDFVLGGEAYDSDAEVDGMDALLVKGDAEDASNAKASEPRQGARIDELEPTVTMMQSLAYTHRSSDSTAMDAAAKHASSSSASSPTHPSHGRPSAASIQFGFRPHVPSATSTSTAGVKAVKPSERRESERHKKHEPTRIPLPTYKSSGALERPVAVVKSVLKSSTVKKQAKPRPRWN